MPTLTTGHGLPVLKKAHFASFVKTLNFTQSLKLRIDFGKRWHWGVQKSFRLFCQDLNALFPAGDVKIDVCTVVKDLGELVSYNKSVSLGFIKDKFAEAVKRVERIGSLPLGWEQQQKLAQTSAWTVAMYSADTTFVNPKYFHSLRRMQRLLLDFSMVGLLCPQ